MRHRHLNFALCHTCWIYTSPGFAGCLPLRSDQPHNQLGLTFPSLWDRSAFQQQQQKPMQQLQQHRHGTSCQAGKANGNNLCHPFYICWMHAKDCVNLGRTGPTTNLCPQVPCKSHLLLLDISWQVPNLIEQKHDNTSLQKREMSQSVSTTGKVEEVTNIFASAGDIERPMDREQKTVIATKPTHFGLHSILLDLCWC